MVFAAGLLVVSSGCARAEEKTTTTAATTAKQPATPAAAENPFTRPSVEPQTPACTTATLDIRGEAAISSVSIENSCEYAVAVLTSPMEIRVRRTGTEKFVHERMSWTAYALLYVVAAEVGNEAFRGDGVIRDGGLRVRRGPGYMTIPARETVKVPMECAVDVPAGRYALLLMTYEATQGDAPSKADAFDCGSTVAAYNTGVESTPHVSLGGDVREVQSASAMLEVRPQK